MPYVPRMFVRQDPTRSEEHRTARSEEQLELELVPYRNPVRGHLGDRGFDRASNLVDRARSERSQSIARLLIEGECDEVVVRRHEPDAPNAAPSELVGGCSQERAPQPSMACVRNHDQTGDLGTPIELEPPCQEADTLGVMDRDEACAAEHIDELPAAGLQPATELAIEERLCPVGILRRIERADRVV